MFRIEPVYIKDPKNDGDLFTITCSRNELKHIKDALELAVTHEPNEKAQALLEEIRNA